MINIVETPLSDFFTEALVTVNHDLAASAYACYQGTPEIACILGTGSNACYFDGKTIYQATPSLGYILGDEGSGSYFGKHLLSDFLYHKLPKEIAEEMKGLGLNKDVILERIYRQPNPNTYIASFMPVMIKYKDLDYCQRIIKTGLQKFIDTHVKCYDQYQNTEVNFVGSIASLLKNELEDICKTEGITIGRIIQRPLDHLAGYHMKHRDNSE